MNDATEPTAPAPSGHRLIQAADIKSEAIAAMNPRDAERAQQVASYYQQLIDAGVPDDLARQLVRDWHAYQLGDFHSLARAIDGLRATTITRSFA